MRKQALSIFLMIVLLLPQLVFGQSRQVTGRIVDSKGEPLPLASVVVKGTNNGVTADENGNFTINVTGNNTTLVVSSAGLQPKEIRLGTANTYSITLDETGGLAEVVVTALGVRQEKKALVLRRRVLPHEEARALDVVGESKTNQQAVAVRRGGGHAGIATAPHRLEGHRALARAAAPVEQLHAQGRP